MSTIRNIAVGLPMRDGHVLRAEQLRGELAAVDAALAARED